MPNISANDLDLRAAHFLRCLEQADVTRQLLPPAMAVSLPDATAASHVAHSQQLLARLPRLEAEAVQKALVERRLLPWPGLERWWRPILLGAALLVGWCSHQFGAERRMDILAFPLFGLILWNLAVFGLGLVHALQKPSPQVSALPLALAELPAAGRQIAALAWQKFSKQEAAWTGRATVARRAFWLHLAALFLAAGVIAGMYSRGLAREFHAAWESTFLQTQGVHTFLHTLLGPAHHLTGLPLPNTAEVAQMQLPFPSANIPLPARQFAAPLIHLWGLTAAFTIGFTRLILILVERKHAQGLRTAPARRLALLNTATGAPSPAQTCLVVPIYYGPENRTLETLRPLLAGLWQGQTQPQVLPSMMLGEEEEYLAAHDLRGQDLVLLFSLSATPEMDVHGATVREIRASSSRRFLVALDAFSFDARHQDQLEHAARKAQRLANWQRLLGADLIPILLDEHARDNLHAVLQQHLFPT